MRKSAELINTINDLGNALTSIGWPTVKTTNNEYDTKAIYKKLTQLNFDVKNIENDFYDCTNELCIECGKYANAHLGACDSCRWKKAREGLK